MVKDKIITRRLTIDGRRVRVALEPGFWEALGEIAEKRSASVTDLIGTIYSERHVGNIRVSVVLFVLDYYRQRNIAEAADK